MHLLITGGTGFIGQELCAYLDITYNITLLVRDIEKAQKLYGDKYEYIRSLDVFLQQDIMPDAIINLAGESLAEKRWNESRKTDIYNSRINLTDTIYHFIKESRIKPKVLINGSAIGYYGDTGNLFIDEDYPPGNDYAANLCLDWEKSAEKATSEGVRVVCLRIAMVLGNGGALKKMLPAYKLGLGGRLGDGKQFVSWIHIHDLLRIICFCLEQKTITGAINASSPRPVTNKLFTQYLAKSVKRFAIIPVPAFLLRLLLGEMAELLLTGQRVIPKKLINAGFKFNYPSIKVALDNVVSDRKS